MSNLPVYTPCTTCGVTTIGKTAWRNRSPLARETLKQQGIAMRRANQCSPCYTREAWSGDTIRPGYPHRDDTPRRTRVTRDILLAEWEHFVDRELSVAENCRRIAPRLGMRWRTMETALWRAGIGRAA